MCGPALSDTFSSDVRHFILNIPVRYPSSLNVASTQLRLTVLQPFFVIFSSETNDIVLICDT